MDGVQRQNRRLHVAFRAHFHHQDALLLVFLAEGVGHRRAAVTQRFTADFHRLVDVPQRGIVKIRNHRRGNRIQIADLPSFIIRTFNIRRVTTVRQEELMADQHIPLIGIQRRQRQQPCKGFWIA